ncbi:MAG: NAD(P)-binding domain-containing protein [Solirubrobacterales bacterium]
MTFSRRPATRKGAAIGEQRIGFIGLGNMGAGMACRLAESGFRDTTWRFTTARARRLSRSPSSGPAWPTRRRTPRRALRSSC